MPELTEEEEEQLEGFALGAREDSRLVSVCVVN